MEAAAEKGGDATDRLRVKQKVIPAIRVSTYEATIVQMKDAITMEIEKPKDAIPGRGGINVTLKPKLAEGVSGITEYMKWYPYSCLEQKTSIAIALRDEARWKEVVRALTSHMDSDGTSQIFPIDATRQRCAHSLCVCRFRQKRDGPFPKVLKRR